MNREIKDAKECSENFISARIDIALLRLYKDAEYQTICLEMESIKSMKKVNDFDQLIMERYIESSVIKSTMEHRKIYIQGVRDALRYLSND